MQNITIHINGKEIAAQISDGAAAELLQERKTGYERVEKGKNYYRSQWFGNAMMSIEECLPPDDAYYEEAADYYSDQTIAENNARADRLMRRLRQWQALNDEPVDWSDPYNHKWYIWYDYVDEILEAEWHRSYRNAGVIYFTSHNKAEEAIEVFRDELTWYFTEYRQRLDEPNRTDEE